MDSRIWWMLLLRGLVSLALGVALVAWPRESAEAVIMLIGIFAVLTGAIMLIHAVAARDFAWPHMLPGGVITIALGLLALLVPATMATIMILLFAIWVILLGIIQLISAALLGRMRIDAVLIRGMGVISLIFGVVLLIRPDLGIAAAGLLIGVYLLLSGAMSVWNALQVRSARI